MGRTPSTQAQSGDPSAPAGGADDRVAGGVLDQASESSAPATPPLPTPEDFGMPGCEPVRPDAQQLPDEPEELDRSERRALRRRNFIERGEL